MLELLKYIFSKEDGILFFLIFFMMLCFLIKSVVDSITSIFKKNSNQDTNQIIDNESEN